MKSAWLILLTAATAWGAGPTPGPPSVQGVGIEQRLNAQLPLNTNFRDENGATIQLGSLLNGKPMLLVPVYYGCPMLCSQILSGVVAGLRPLSIKPGKDFEVVAISFDPSDTPAIAKEKREHYSHSYSSRAGTTGWHFLTGDPSSIAAVMNAIGFHYRWDQRNKMFVHASGVMLISPEGRISHYLFGVDYEPKDLKLGLMEASHDQIGTPVDQILLYCYHYDPSTGKYGLLVLNVLRGAGVLTLLLLAGGLGWLWRKDIYKHRQEVPPAI